MRQSTKKILIVITFIIFGITTQVLSQRTIKGKVIDEKNRPVMGVTIYPKGSKIGAITDGDGTFHTQIPDSINELFLVIDNTYFIEGAQQLSIGMFDAIREKFTIENRDSINFRLIHTQNTFNKIPESSKIGDLHDKWYKYELKYNLFGRLQHVYLKNPERNNEIQYVWDIEYHKDYIRIKNYKWHQEKVNTPDNKFFISTIDITYDKNGAIREKAVLVDYSNHYKSTYEKYYYRDNEVSNVFYYEGIERPYYKNAESWEYKRDILIEVVQNEILRRKLYRKTTEKFFNSNYKIIEIK